MFPTRSPPKALVGALPLLDVDWELVSDQDFRALLAALNFEASCNPTKRELTIRVTLVPELTHPDGPRAPLLFVPPAVCPRGEPNERGDSAPVMLAATYCLDVDPGP
jgi:hypothetical protein